MAAGIQTTDLRHLRRMLYYKIRHHRRCLLSLFHYLFLWYVNLALFFLKLSKELLFFEIPFNREFTIGREFKASGYSQIENVVLFFCMLSTCILLIIINNKQLSFVNPFDKYEH